MEKYYISTAIAYTSAKPHLGNTYEIVLADAIARFKRLQGYDVYFQTGTDEHGEKIEGKALEANMTPQEYVDNIACQIKDIWDIVNTSYDKFVRTTNKEHEEIVQKIFKKFYDNGDIYKGEYKGLYCTPCESFWTSSQLVDGKCPDCGREVHEKNEEAYFFKMSKYSKWLEDYINEHPDFIMPEARKNEIINNFIKPGLQDLCVSRTSFKWGIPVTFDENHVIYVWIDALSNYITFLGYNPDGESSETFKKYWPANVHLIGKDILRFHTIYWPIMLHCLGLEMPKHIFGHPWLLFASDKMSKSKGNIVYADDLVEKYGVDAVRYYLLHEIPFASDGNFTIELLENSINSDLANVLGNLVNRTIGMINKYFDGEVENTNITEDIDDDLKNTISNSIAIINSKMDEFKIADALDELFNIFRRCNKYIDETAPWVLAKDESKKAYLENVLYNLLECIRLLGLMLSPIIPDSSKSIAEQLNSDNTVLAFGAVNEYSVGAPTPLFARLDAEKVLAEIAAEKAAEQKKAENVVTMEQIGIEDFAKVELRAAKITACEPIPKAKKLLKLTLDDGSGLSRTVASGIAMYYKPEELIGHTVIVVANLKPAKLCGVESNGMILAADCADNDVKVLFIDNVPAGSKIR